jgi:hypothetical protein
MNPELERAGRALVTLVSTACVTWWLWPTGLAERREPRQEPVQLVDRSSVVPVTPIAAPPPPPSPPAEPPPAAQAEPAASALPSAPVITATARAAEPREVKAGDTAPRSVESPAVLPKVRGSMVRIGFGSYRDAMRALGGGFFLYDAAAKRPVAEIDPVSGAVLSEALRDGLSDWPRDVTSDLASALELGQKRYGPRVSRVVLMWPAALDTALIAALQRELPPLGVAYDEVVRVDVVYELRAGRLECDVVGVGLRDAGDRALELRVTLSDPIPGLSYQTSREEMQHA